MSFLRTSLAMTILLMANSALAGNVTATTKTLQKGMWQDEACVANPKRDTNESCLCEADISYVRISGIPKAQTINADLLKRATQATYGMGEGTSPECHGKKIDETKIKDGPNHTTNDFSNKIEFENDALLVIAADEWYYGEGAAHGNGWSNALIIDKATGTVLKPTDIIAAKDLPALNRDIHKKLKTTEGSFLSDCHGDKGDQYGTCPKRPEVYVGDEKAVGYLTLDKDGLKVNFNAYAVGPYSSGDIEVPVASRFIKYPSIKELSKKAGA